MRLILTLLFLYLVFGLMFVRFSNAEQPVWENATVIQAEHQLDQAAISVGWQIEFGTTVSCNDRNQCRINQIETGTCCEVNIPLPPDAIVMIHTHPDSLPPSAKDIQNSKKWKVPGIVLSQTEDWLIDIDGKVERIP